MRFFIHVDDYYCGTDRSDVVHAIDGMHRAQVSRDRREGRTRRKTYDAVCGRRFVRLYACRSWLNSGEPIRVAHGWPPPVRKLREIDDRERCRECWEQTGKKRPHRLWKTVEPIREPEQAAHPA